MQLDVGNVDAWMSDSSGAFFSQLAQAQSSSGPSSPQRAASLSPAESHLMTSSAHSIVAAASGVAGVAGDSGDSFSGKQVNFPAQLSVSQAASDKAWSPHHTAPAPHHVKGLLKCDSRDMPSTGANATEEAAWDALMSPPKALVVSLPATACWRPATPPLSPETHPPVQVDELNSSAHLLSPLPPSPEDSGGEEEAAAAYFSHALDAASGPVNHAVLVPTSREGGACRQLLGSPAQPTSPGFTAPPSLPAPPSIPMTSLAAACRALEAAGETPLTPTDEPEPHNTPPRSTGATGADTMTRSLKSTLSQRSFAVFEHLKTAPVLKQFLEAALEAKLEEMGWAGGPLPESAQRTLLLQVVALARWLRTTSERWKALLQGSARLMADARRS